MKMFYLSKIRIELVQPCRIYSTGFVPFHFYSLSSMIISSEEEVVE